MRVACQQGHVWHTEAVNDICPVCGMSAKTICSTNEVFSFPRTCFADSTSIWRQYRHLVSEVIEVGMALLFRDYQHASRELWDICHSSETGNHILRDNYGVDARASRIAVVRGNQKRGYYVSMTDLNGGR